MTTAAINEPSGPTRLLNISEVAETLGVDVRHVRRLVHERRIPYIKWGHLLRFDPTELEQWIDRHRRSPTRLA
jgi:excisionase family DNA binding protein